MDERIHVTPKLLWLELDMQHNELPLIVADSAEELARLAGVSLSSVKSAASHARRGRRRKFISVWIGD